MATANLTEAGDLALSATSGLVGNRMDAILARDGAQVTHGCANVSAPITAAASIRDR